MGPVDGKLRISAGTTLSDFLAINTAERQLGLFGIDGNRYPGGQRKLDRMRIAQGKHHGCFCPSTPHDSQCRRFQYHGSSPLVNTPSTALLTRSPRQSMNGGKIDRSCGRPEYVHPPASIPHPKADALCTWPLGPFTTTVLPSLHTSLPCGSGIGFFPIRDMDKSFSSESLETYLRLRVPQTVSSLALLALSL